MDKILIVEDETDIREIVSFNLERAGFKTVKAASAEEGINLIDDSIRLILLDVMLPGMSGFEMASLLRMRGITTPVIFLTARTSEEDLLIGFHHGADDYIGKPFSASELLARVRAVLKRTYSLASSSESCGPLTMNIEAGVATLDGAEIEFSRKEFDILSLLIRNQGNYFSRSELIKQIWVDAPYVVDRTIDVHITHIRNKLGIHKNILVSRIGFGYSLIYEK